MTDLNPRPTAKLERDGSTEPQHNDTVRLERQTSTWTRVPSPWRPFSRILWALIVVTAAAVYVLGIPRQYSEVLSRSAYSAAALAESGLSPEFVAGYDVAMNVLQGAVFVATALLIFVRRPDDRSTLITSVMLVTFGTSVISGIPEALVRAIPQAHIPAALIDGIGNASLLVFLYTFPDGQFSPGWTRWPAFAYAVWAMLSALFPGAVFSSAQWPSYFQFGVPMAAYVSAMILHEWRKRRYLTAQRLQQAKWAQVGLGFALAGWVGLFAVEWAAPLLLPSVPPILVDMALQVFLLVTLTAVPIGMTFSMLRYRLWDVDFVINRSLIYGLLTALLVGVFLGLVIGLQELLQMIGGGQQSTLALAASALVIGALFQPARRLLRQFVDRKFFGIYVNYHHRDFSLRPASPHDLSGATLGIYTVEEPLGRGGMADVYKGRHTTLGRPVAIKVLPSAHAKEEDFVRRFEQEAQTIAALRHPNIVGLYDFGQADGTYFMVMEYIAGRDLADVIREGAPLPLEQVKAYMRDIANALDYAHEQGIVHRDVKPSNVMLQPDTTQSGRSAGERAILTDFGIAKLLSAATRLTRTGLLGTFDYMAPEQIRDQPDVDRRVDVYAMGCMAYEMLTGQLPFRAAHPGAVLIAHLQQPVLDPRTVRPDLPDRVSAAVLRAMEKSPGNRWPTAGGFVAALG